MRLFGDIEMLKATFVKEKETKTTFRYKEVTETGLEPIQTIYIKKFAVQQHKLGDKIQVTVEPAK